jgi:pyridoxine 5'-phosphate synthase PdxJ
MSTMGADLSDDELLAALKRAVAERNAVPPDFIEAAQAAFAWHNIDAELAQLTYDSLQDTESASTTRAEAASIRALTFTSARLTIELEVAHDALVGQIVPAQPAAITVVPRTGAEVTVEADDIGCFSIEPIPLGQFRLRCQTAADVEALTGWITL